MKDEANLGKFDAQGNFTWTRRDLEEEEDEAWLEEVGEEIAAPLKLNTATTEENPPTQEAIREQLSILIEALLPEESSLEAIRRCRSDKTKVAGLTEACNVLLMADLENVYSMKRQQLAGLLPKLQWEYRVLKSSEIHGLFNGYDMQCWRDEGFFTQDAEELCEVRLSDSESWIEAHQVRSFLTYPH
jgi:GYF domain